LDVLLDVLLLGRDCLQASVDAALESV
jgi:hypothetical protein